MALKMRSGQKRGIKVVTFQGNFFFSVHHIIRPQSRVSKSRAWKITQTWALAPFLESNIRIGKSDSDLDDLDDGETQPRWTRFKRDLFRLPDPFVKVIFDIFMLRHDKVSVLQEQYVFQKNLQIICKVCLCF